MNKKGQALVEFVIILPVFLFLLFIVIDFGKILFTKINLENNLNDVVSMYDDGKSIKNINSFLKKNDSTAKLKVTNENNENVIFTITSNVNISTPGLNKILDSPYKVEVRRVIYNGS